MTPSPLIETASGAGSALKTSYSVCSSTTCTLPPPPCTLTAKVGLCRGRRVNHLLFVSLASCMRLTRADLAVFINLRNRDKIATAQPSPSAQIDRLAARLVLLPVVYLCGVRQDPGVHELTPRRSHPSQ